MTENLDAIKALFAAMKEFPRFQKDGRNPHFQSDFVTLDNILNTVRPILAKHGLFPLQPTFHTPDGAGIRTVLIHAETGQRVELGEVVVPVNKKDAQGYGSAITYGRRYNLQTGLCLTTGEDDDGSAAASAKPDDQMSVKTRIAGIAKKKGFTGKDEMRNLIALVRRKIDAPDTLAGWQDVEAYIKDTGKEGLQALFGTDDRDDFAEEMAGLVDEQKEGRKI